MKVGWLHDDPGYLGGAELTQAEFRAVAPKGVEVIESPPGAVKPGLDAYCVHNCMTYPAGTREAFGKAPVFRYHHDLNRQGELDGWLDDHAAHIFCSPLQRERFDLHGHLVPPAIDLKRFRDLTMEKTGGNVCIGRMSYGKGMELLAEYPELVDVYSSVPVASEGNARYKGAAKDVPSVLRRYKRFVFLPTAIEPFGRSVVEAWAAGLELVLNGNVGARYWIEQEPGALETAGERFWGLVCGC